MGVIKKLFGALFSFLGSIFKIFNIFKKSEYFLEADAAQSGGGANKASDEKPAPTVTTATAAAKPATATSTELAASTTSAAAKSKASEPAKAKPTPAPSAPAPAAAAPTPAKPAPTPQPAGPKVFAPDYLISPGSTGGRRRPGPSLSPFMDMAKQVKVK